MVSVDKFELQGLSEKYQRDGVVVLPQALSKETMQLARQCYEWSLQNPTAAAVDLLGSAEGHFYQDLSNPAAFETYDKLLKQPELAALISSLWGSPDVWFMYEQVFKKSGGQAGRTPWHQDTSYLPVQGTNLAVMWISFDDVAPQHALEFVRGSHQGVLYDGSRFDPRDATAPLYGDGSMPRLPDIEASRERWSIVSWKTIPGDVIVFHPSVLHGGGDTSAEQVRRTLSLRFFGNDAVVARRPGADGMAANVLQSAEAADVHPLTCMRTRAQGEPFRHARFPKIV